MPVFLAFEKFTHFYTHYPTDIVECINGSIGFTRFYP